MVRLPALRRTPTEPAYEPVDVAFVAEATYPYQKGGVASIIHGIIAGLPDLSIGVVHISWDRTSHGASVYSLPENVKWVYNLYLSSREHAPLPRALPFTGLPLTASGRRTVAAEIFAAYRAARAGDFAPLRQAFLDYFHPPTRRYDFWRLYRTPEFLAILQEEFRHVGLSVTELFWLQRELFSLLYAILNRRYPQATVYHSHIQLSGGLAAVIAARQHDGRAVLTEHGLYVRDSLNYLFKRCASHDAVVADDLAAVADDPRKRAWIHWFVTLGDVVHELIDATTYQYTRHAEVASQFGARPDKIRLISNGLEVERYAGARKKQAVRHGDRRAGFADKRAHEWRLAYMGRIVYVKGIAELIRAAAILRREVSWSFRLEVIGPATEEPQCLADCRALAAELGLQDVVDFPGPKDLTEALGHVDAVILPSYSEALPIVLLEAMAAGVPVIGTDTGSTDEIVAETIDRDGHEIGAAGLVVPTRDVPALAAAMRRLIEDPALYEACHRNGPERILARHHAPSVVKRYRDLYCELGMVSSSSRRVLDAVADLALRERCDAPGDMIAFASP